MELASIVVFFLVYLGMVLGNLPGFALDRTGIALLGAIAFIELQDISLSHITDYVDFSAIAILFSFMIISAQFYYSGFYTRIADRIEKWNLSPSSLLLVVILISALLSAVLLNDIVCLAFTPLVIRGCFNRKLNPLPFLIGLACASNIGSAMTLVGNPQNLLIGQVLDISFTNYLKYSFVPCLLGLFATWLIMKVQTKHNWYLEGQKRDFEAIPFDCWQSIKGIILVCVLLLFFFISNLPRDQISLVIAGFLLLSRRMTSQKMLNFIDWQLLVLFIGLFIVNKGILSTQTFEVLPQFLHNHHIDVQAPAWLMVISATLSNIVSNVPAVMLILPFIKNPFEGSLLALSSTLAGNFFIVGSIANLIVISQAARFGIKITWKEHLRTGVPVTIISFVLVIGWLYLIAN